MSRHSAVILTLLSGFLVLGAVSPPFEQQPQAAVTASPTPRGAGPSLSPTPSETSTPTATFTPTPSFTPTITPTLEPLPADGGRVAARMLVVRAGPSQEWRAIGGLDYGTPVYPRARTPASDWVLIEYNGREGWINASLVQWGLDINRLPEQIPPGLPPIPTETPYTPPPAITNTPPPTPAPTSTLVPPTPSIMPTYTPSATIRAIVLSPTEASPSPQPVDAGQAGFPSSSLLIFGGAAAVLVVFYGWRLAGGMRNIRRYANGFVLDWCPVCRAGHLELEEHVRRPLGVPRVRRVVRCDACRSVLREVRPGVWRYTVDPIADADFAVEYNGKLLNDAGLAALAPVASHPKEEKSGDPSRETDSPRG